MIRPIVHPLFRWRLWLGLASLSFAVAFVTLLFPVSLPRYLHAIVGVPHEFVSVVPDPGYGTLRSLVYTAGRWGMYACLPAFVVGYLLLYRQQERSR